MDHSFASALVLLLLVLDPLGGLPVYISVLERVDPARRARLALRESVIAFLLLLAFMLGGQGFLSLMNLSERALEVAGGVILMIIAIRMIFARDGVMPIEADGREPLIFPLAVPLLAGPSALATVLLLASRQPDRLLHWVAALAVAMGLCLLVLLSAARLQRWLGEPLVRALEKLMGLLLTAIAVEMLLSGLQRYFR
ncbi:MarC family protein [Piscinibacter sp. Jin2]|uniref:UPF0056 membrane protein n=1 Tax=Aquariibacter lacus TaxID=2801332 RepID=A0A9X1BQF2_9BURK|nr:MarC family protein [Piscinibacter lacus]MBL0719641.1 MarC family protein [Piscinibacter lacus]